MAAQGERQVVGDSMNVIPLICRVCRFSRDTLPHRDDPIGTAFVISRCFDCGHKSGHDQVLVEYLDRFGRILGSYKS